MVVNAAGPWVRGLLEGSDLIKTEEDEEASNVLENLRQCVEADDRILVIQVKGDSAQFNSLTSDSGLSVLIK